MMGVLLFSLAAGVACGIVLVGRGGPENSLIGLNVATVCAVTLLLAMQEAGVAFSRDIAFYLIFPGVFGVIVFTRFLAEVRD